MASKNKSNNNNKESSHVPIRVYISVIGLALFTFFTFFGLFLKDGDMGMSLITAIIFTSVLSVALWLMTYAKRREDNDLRKWKVVEYAVLGLYIVLALLFAKPTLRFFAVNSDKENMKETALADIAVYEQLLIKFENEQKADLNHEITTIKTALVSERTRSAKDSLKRWEIYNSADADTHAVFISKDIMRNTQYLHDKLNDCSSIIEAWNLFEIPNVVRMINNTLRTAIPDILNSYSEYRTFYIFEQHNGKYDIKAADKHTYEAPSEAEIHFPDKIKRTTNITPVSTIIFILLHAIILFGYYMAYRSKRTKIGKTIEDDGGILLKF